jgi:hypothetical protein
VKIHPPVFSVSVVINACIVYKLYLHQTHIVYTMRIFFVASLLLSGSIAFFESAVEIPSSFRDVLQSYAAKRDEFLQYSQEQITRRVFAQIQSADANHRDLQTAPAPTRGPLCNADGSVNFDDDFSQIVYSGDFETTCYCSEGALSTYSPYRLQFWRNEF